MKFNPLNVPTHWQNYWTRFPEGHTILEALISWVSQVDDMVDNQNNLNTTVENYGLRLDDFLDRFDTNLRNTAEETLKDWQNSGFLDVVISSALQWQLDDYIATNEQDKLSLTAQLQQKLSQGEVKVSDINKNYGLLDETYLSDALKAQMAGTTDIGSTPPDKSITPVKTTFFTNGKNLFNKATAIVGQMVVDTTGNLYTDAGYFASDYISVLPNATYTRSHEYSLAFYDSDKKFISGISPNEDLFTFTTPSNCYFIRVSAQTPVLDTFQVEKGNVKTSYEAFTYILDTRLLPKKFITNEMLNDKTVSIEKTDFIVAGKNKFDKTKATLGFYVNNTNGQLSSHAGYYSSEFIEIKPNTNYIDTQPYYLAFYDENKSYISGLTVGHEEPYSSPTNAKHIRISVPTNLIDSYQLEEGTSKTDYEPFGLVIEGGLYEPLRKSSSFKPEISIANKIPALVGKEVNIYFENIMNDRANKYDINVTCSIGKQQKERWTCVPTTAGTYPITIDIYEKFGLVASVTSEIVVKEASVGTGVTKKVLILGDSTTANGVAVTELVNLFSSDVMDISMLGTRGTLPNNHEGIGGWTANKWRTLAKDAVTPDVNNFYNPITSAFDFSYYMNQQGYSDLNYVVINLGINDTFSYTSDEPLNSKITTILEDYQFLIDSIKSFSSTIKIGVAVTIPPSYHQDAFSHDYGSGQTRWRYKRNNFIWVKELLNYFKGKESQNIYLVPINVNIDTEYNMGLETVAVNSRNATTVQRGNSGVHPVNSGYYQIADLYYYWLKSFEV